MTKEEIMELLEESGVANDCAHYEDGEIHTVITSYTELVKLITLAFQAGESSCHY